MQKQILAGPSQATILIQSCEPRIARDGKENAQPKRRITPWWPLGVREAGVLVSRKNRRAERPIEEDSSTSCREEPPSNIQPTTRCAAMKTRQWISQSIKRNVQKTARQKAQTVGSCRDADRSTAIDKSRRRPAKDDQDPRLCELFGVFSNLTQRRSVARNLPLHRQTASRLCGYTCGSGGSSGV